MLIGFGVGFIVNSKEFLLFGGDIFLVVLLIYVIVSLRYSSTVSKQGSYLYIGGLGVMVITFILLLIALTGIMSINLLDSGINWLMLCFFLIVIPVVGDINAARYIHKC